MNLVFHSDAGHGWLAIKEQKLKDIGVYEMVSGYSYRKGKTVYLEEDCDAPLAIGRLEELGIPFTIKRGAYQERSNIRSYDSF